MTWPMADARVERSEVALGIFVHSVSWLLAVRCVKINKQSFLDVEVEEGAVNVSARVRGIICDRAARVSPRARRRLEARARDAFATVAFPAPRRPHSPPPATKRLERRHAKAP